MSANNFAPIPLRCPSCAQPMQLIRRTQRFSELPDLCTFECGACGVSLFEECSAPRGTTPNTEIGSGYLHKFGNPTREIKRRD